MDRGTPSEGVARGQFGSEVEINRVNILGAIGLGRQVQSGDETAGVTARFSIRERRAAFVSAQDPTPPDEILT
jgi:hypothetical protein